MRDHIKTILYHMRERCYNPNNKSYMNYGGRGITVCEEWLHDSNAFSCWAKENGYNQALEIDRIDNDKGYSPENCRWVTKKQNVRNTRRNKRITFNGETHPLSEWCEILNLNYQTVNMRLHRGWTFEKAISEKPRDWDSDKDELIGKRIGRLVVKSLLEARTTEGRRQYLCACDCGNECVVTGKLLRSNRTKSCGCLQKEFPGLKPSEKKFIP